jgi:hypothetical protein
MRLRKNENSRRLVHKKYVNILVAKKHPGRRSKNAKQQVQFEINSSIKELTNVPLFE